MNNETNHYIDNQLKSEISINRTVLAMILFIASESIFFLLLILAYVNFHKTTGLMASTELDPIKTGVFSVLLLISSLTMWSAEEARKKGSALFKVWLSVTIILGAVFLIGQGAEYVSLFKRGVTISRDLFGSTFFTLTGFHGLHVFVGLLLLCTLLGLAFFGRKNEPPIPGVQSIAIYWHFVDAVWLVVFSVVYLWRYLA